MKQKKQIIMLPSETGIMSKCKISYSEDVGLAFNKGDLRMDTDGHKDWWENQHLYILSDEEIKVGDWYVSDNHVVLQANKLLMGLVYAEGDHGRQTRHCKKIIATTDAELHYNKIVEEDMHMYKESLPQIPQHIIEAYVKDPFDEVEVEYWNKSMAWMKHEPSHYPKLNPDGTLAVSLVEEKMYSMEEILNALHKVELKHNKNYSKIWDEIKENL